MDFQKIPLDLVKPSPMNPRKTFDETAVNELAANIEKQGLIQPITVRPCEYDDRLDESGEVVSVPTEYEIVCGERRYRAYCKLKAQENEQPGGQSRFGSIPAMVREMSDEEAFEAMITENLQRQDVDPMEEAFAFGLLIRNGKTAEEVALKFGKSIRFVQDRVKLNSLIPELMLAIREDKMSISAAMIICKLNEEQQRKYHSQYSNNYQGLTKATAESFVNGLFLTISKAPWYKSDNQADEEFAGGCGHACSRCQHNTANHGCLFWEMKTENVGKCTDRNGFQSKLLAYMVKVVEEHSDSLVKAGQPLEKGKMVIGLTIETYGSDLSKAVKAAFKEKMESIGYEIVNPASVFSHKCWYGADDERAIEKLAKGEVYRVLNVAGYDVPEIAEEFHYVKKDDQSVNSENGVPMKVNELLCEYRNITSELSLSSSHTVSGCKTISEHGEFKNLKGLDNAEFVLAYSLMVDNNRELCVEFGLGDAPQRDEIIKYVSNNLDKIPYILRSWIKKALSTGPQIITFDEARHMAAPFIDRIGELWCPVEYHEAMDKLRSTQEKAVNKIARQLKELGYNLDGNPISDNTDSID
ncbi:MAG: ParB/RepB/Spo0J family partition protein [Bacteroides sp.]|nr:ParB/RepB/Spo0J family partition protein [Bacteroides sp.]